MDVYSQLVSQIIKDQEIIIGPIALEQARKVEGLNVDNVNDIKIQGDAKTVIGNLVSQYVKLFGQASIEVCKEAVHEIKTAVSAKDLPEILR